MMVQSYQLRSQNSAQEALRGAGAAQFLGTAVGSFGSWAGCPVQGPVLSRLRSALG